MIDFFLLYLKKLIQQLVQQAYLISEVKFNG